MVGINFCSTIQETAVPATIPYDPALALGDLVSDNKLNLLERMSAIQAPADAAAGHLDSLRAVKRSLEMTREELAGMDIDTAGLAAELRDIEASIDQAATQHARSKAEAARALQQLESQFVADPGAHDSPIDHRRSRIARMPPGADSLRMEVRYFPRGEDEGKSRAAMQNFIGWQLDSLGGRLAQQAPAAVQAQLAGRYARGDIAGTLVMSVTCAHKNAVVLAPFMLDADKGVQAWNRMFPDHPIKTDRLEDLMAQARDQTGSRRLRFLRVVSGATYGSFFIGMLHVRDQDGSDKAMHEIASSLQDEFQAGGLFASRTIGDCLDRMPGKGIAAYDTLTLASNAAIAADEVGTAIQRLSEQAAEGPVLVHGGADEASGTGALEKALEDYLKEAIDGAVGVPLHYYVKTFTPAELVQKWVAQHYPHKYIGPADVDASAPGS